jgi:hypothetical protein
MRDRVNESHKKEQKKLSQKKAQNAQIKEILFVCDFCAFLWLKLFCG